MKIIDILESNNEGVAFEFFPPKTQEAKKKLAKAIEKLKFYMPLYVSMTCGAMGSKQFYTQEAVDILLEEKNLVVMPHLTCVDATFESIRNILDYYKKRNVENIMALRGDPPDIEGFDFSKQDFKHASDLVKFIKDYGSFCIGVAVYPETHLESTSFEEDLEYAKYKIDMGADFAVTQMFFDNKHYYNFLEKARKKGIKIPILPGILPLTDIQKVKEFTSVCRVSIPNEIEERMSKFLNNPEDMEKVGLEFTIKQCKELIKNGFKKLHFFTLNRVSPIKTILENLNLFK